MQKRISEIRNKVNQKILNHKKEMKELMEKKKQEQKQKLNDMINNMTDEELEEYERNQYTKGRCRNCGL